MSNRYEIGPCPACDATAATLVAGPDDIRHELELLREFHVRRLRGDTPPERLHDRVAFSQEPPLAVVRCNDCGLLFRNPRERPEVLLETYRDERPSDVALRALFQNQRRDFRAQAKRLTEVFGRTGAGLEVGSYVGGFLAAAHAEGWKFRGVDVNPAANALATRAGFDVFPGTIEQLDDGRRYDVIAFWNTFDQLADPRSAVRAARDRLNEGGMVVIRVPNGTFYERWRRRLSSGVRGSIARAVLVHNNLLAFPYRHGFSPASLARLLGREGFRPESAVGEPLVNVSDRWTKPWARLEARALRIAVGNLTAEHAPWFELYARKAGQQAGGGGT